MNMKTFIFGQIGKSPISHLIQKNTRKSNFPESLVWSHVGALVINESDWWIYESHFKAGGIIKHKFPDSKKHLEIYEYELNVEKLESLIGCEYGTKDVIDLAKWNLFSDKKNEKGYFCSEYIAICSDLEHVIKKPAHLITPHNIQCVLQSV